MTMTEMYSAVDAFNAIKALEDNTKDESEATGLHRAADIILNCFYLEKYYHWNPLANALEPNKEIG